MKRAELVEKNHPELSVRKQCALLSVMRSVYYAPAQLIRRLSRPAPPSELPCGSLSRPFPKASIRPSGQPSVSLSRACPGARLSLP